MPWILPPGDSLNVSIEYNPKDITQDNLYLEVDSNDPNLPNKINIYDGIGFVEREATEYLEVSETRVVDMIFVIDNSGSMMIFQNSLAGHFIDFLNIFITLNVDYRIAVISTDNYNFLEM